MPPHDLLSYIKHAHGQKPSNIYKSLATLNLIQLGRLDPVTIPNPSLRQQLLVRLLKKTFAELPISMTDGHGGDGAAGAEHGQEKETPKVGETEGPLGQLERAAEVLLERGVECEGIFRLARSSNRPEELRAQIMRGEAPPMWEEDPFDLAALFKGYLLKSLPGMLSEAAIEEITRTGSSRAFLETLPTERRTFLAILGRVCRAIDAQQARNKMDLSNLARVVAPNMFQHHDASVELRLIAATIEATKVILQQA